MKNMYSSRYLQTLDVDLGRASWSYSKVSKMNSSTRGSTTRGTRGWASGLQCNVALPAIPGAPHAHITPQTRMRQYGWTILDPISMIVICDLRKIFWKWWTMDLEWCWSIWKICWKWWTMDLPKCSMIQLSNKWIVNPQAASSAPPRRATAPLQW